MAPFTGRSPATTTRGSAMHPYHPFWSLEVPRVDGQLLLTPCPG
ncbi:TPA: protein tyrosine phosphatase, partial [Aeromonas veronii]